MTTKFLVMMLAFLSFSAAQAADAPDAYVTLKAFYENASKPATIEDLTSIGNLTCVIADGAGTPIASEIVYGFQSNVVIPGIPAQGPVLPGTPDHTVASCVTWSEAIGAPISSQWFCSNEVITASATDLSVSAPFYVRSSGASSIVSVAPTIVSFRLNGKLLAIKVDQSYVGVDPASGQSETIHSQSYSYCY